MGCRELLGKEPCHGRLALQPQESPTQFEDSSQGVSNRKRNALLHFRRIRGAQQVVDDLARRERLAVADEVGAAGAGRGRPQRVERAQVRILPHFLQMSCPCGSRHRRRSAGGRRRRDPPAAAAAACRPGPRSAAAAAPRWRAGRRWRRAGAARRSSCCRVPGLEVLAVRRAGFIAPFDRRAAAVGDARREV
jgi:hypothetical protein